MTKSGKSKLPAQWCFARLEEIAEINPKLDKSEIADDLEVSFVPMSAVEVETGSIDVSEIRRFRTARTSVRQGRISASVLHALKNKRRS